MFSLRDLRFLLCSLDLDVLRVQRIIGFFLKLNHPQINKAVGKSGHVDWLCLSARLFCKYNFLDIVMYIVIIVGAVITVVLPWLCGCLIMLWQWVLVSVLLFLLRRFTTKIDRGFFLLSFRSSERSAAWSYGEERNKTTTRGTVNVNE